MEKKQSFTTTRHGKINFLTCYLYRFSPSLNSKPELKQKFIKWLQKSQDKLFFRCNQTGFETFSRLDAENWQYIFVSENKWVPPFDNLSEISRYIKAIVISQLNLKYKTFDNVFIFSSSIHHDFLFLKCFYLNVEIFKDGRFLIHFYSLSKYTASHKDIASIIRKIRQNTIEMDENRSIFYISDNISGKSIALYPFKKSFFIELSDFIDKYSDFKVSFNFEFLNNCFPAIFSKMIALSKNKINPTIEMLQSVSSMLTPIDGINHSHHAMLPIALQPVLPEMNLRIGSEKLVSKLSATYFSGIYLPVKHATVLPVIVGNDMYILENIKKLMSDHFNAGGNILWLEAFQLDEDNLNEVYLRSKKNENPDVFVLLVTSYHLRSSTTDFLQKSRFKFQIYQGPLDNFKISNFAVKCLLKMGGWLAMINDLKVPKDAYFVGIDLGHAHGHGSNPGHSTLVMVFFDNHGKFLYKSSMDNLPLNEVLQKNNLEKGLLQFENHLNKISRKSPATIIYHRDGRIHHNEIEHFKEATQNIFHHENIEIIEIIKSGHPYVYVKEGLQYSNPVTSSYWMVPDLDYGILITNDQGTATRELLNPLIIKRKYGTLPFKDIISQIYWFCKVYTNNIYYPSRLPATTELANNRAGTGSKRYQPTYKKE